MGVYGLTTSPPFSIFTPGGISMSSQKRCLISRNDIARRVAELGEQIGRDYAGQDLVMVGILKGVFIFMADLVRALPFSVEVDFVRLCSYGVGTTSSGEVHITKDVEMPLKDRDVLIVEDIVDTGLTLAFLKQHLAGHRPRSLKICCLIDKKERREVEVPLDYVGFPVEKGFLVGYGLDCGEKSRTLPEIYVVEKD
jgi:hypoxanthine phosphoribosyltransferase